MNTKTAPSVQALSLEQIRACLLVCIFSIWKKTQNNKLELRYAPAHIALRGTAGPIMFFDNDQSALANHIFKFLKSVATETDKSVVVRINGFLNRTYKNGGDRKSENQNRQALQVLVKQFGQSFNTAWEMAGETIVSADERTTIFYQPANIGVEPFTAIFAIRNEVAPPVKKGVLESLTDYAEEPKVA